MPDPRDLLPPPPWEGPPIPRGIIKYVSPEERYRLVKRTKRGSLVIIEREGNKAIVDVTNMEDMRDLTRLLDAAGIRFNMYQPPKLVGRGWRVEFDFSELEKVMASLEKELLLLP